MSTPIAAKAPIHLNQWNNDYISPGPVGSVGDTLLAVQLKTSFPGDLRYDKLTKGAKECRFGSNVTDGYWTSFATGAGPAKVKDNIWSGDRSDKTSHGWIYQDLRAVDRSETAVLAATPQYSWRTKVATTNRAATPGTLFPIPAGGMIEPPVGGMMRGGMFPAVVATEAGTRPAQLSAPPAVGIGAATPYRDMLRRR